MIKVLVFGTFDCLHKGHIDFLKQARKYGDFLIAIVGRDKNVEKLKNHHPIKNEQQRLKDLIDCKFVDRVLLGNKKNPYELIKIISPNVICLGYDQRYFADSLEDELKKMGLSRIKTYRLKPYKPEKFKSSRINKKS
jgi:FAD synthetase